MEQLLAILNAFKEWKDHGSMSADSTSLACLRLINKKDKYRQKAKVLVRIKAESYFQRTAFAQVVQVFIIAK